MAFEYRNLLLTIALAIILLPGSLLSTATTSEFSIALDKQEYFLNEPIWLDINLINVSSDSVALGWLCLECDDNSLRIEIYQADSQLKYTVAKWSTTVGDKSEFKYGTGEGIYLCHELLEDFGIWDHGALGQIWFRYLKPGTYKIRATHFGKYSNEVEFEVVQPSGSEKGSYQALKNIYYSRTQENKEEIKSKLENFALTYPHSVYIEKVLWDLGRYDEILERFPESGYNSKVIRTQLPKINSSEKKYFLEQIIKAHPNTRISKIAGHYIKYLREAGE